VTRLRFGLAGVGAGAKNLLTGFGQSELVKLAAAADVRPEALAALNRQFGARTYSSVEEMCRDPDLDVIWVATPNPFHAEHAIAALNHGKHVIVSKPMAVTLDQCEAMNAAAERNGRYLLAGHSQAMAAPIRKMAELVASGEYGRLAMVHTWHYTDWFYRPRLPDELDEARGGGVVFRQSPHQVDIVRAICGGEMVDSVSASTFRLDADRPGTGAYTAFLRFAGGAAATLAYSGYGRFNAAEITFGQGRARTAVVRGRSGSEEELALKESSRYTGSDALPVTHGQPFFGLTVASCERADIRQSPNGLYVYDESGQSEITLPPDEQRGEAEFQEMHEAVVHGRPLTHSGRWGQRTHEVTLAIVESARLGHEVRLSKPTAAI